MIINLISIPILVFLLSTFTLYFSGKKAAKKTQNKLWNAKTKIVFKKYSFGFCLIFLVLAVLFYIELTNYYIPVFLILYGILLFLLKNKKRKDFLILSGVSVLLGVLCFLIPSYWHSSLSILGIAHIAYGVVVKD
jgi:Na+/H+ antiporter NhaD/arsenite permease-like protein